MRQLRFPGLGFMAAAIFLPVLHAPVSYATHWIGVIGWIMVAISIFSD